MRFKKFLSVFSGFSLVVFLVLLLLSLLVFSLTSGVLLFPSLVFNPFVDVSIVYLVVLISVLFSANLLVFFNGFNFSKFLLLGSFSGVFTTACPLCAPVFFGWLGFGSFFGLFSGFSFYFGLLSVVLLSFALWFSLGDCKVKGHGKGV